MTDTTVISMSSPAPSMAFPGAAPSTGRASPGRSDQNGSCSGDFRFGSSASQAFSPLRLASSISRISTSRRRTTPTSRPTRSPSCPRSRATSPPCMSPTTVALRRTSCWWRSIPATSRSPSTARKPTCKAPRRRKPTCSSNFDEQTHLIAAAQATVESDRAILQFAQQQLARYGTLAKTGAGTEERLQQAVSDIGRNKAILDHDLAALAAAQAQVGVLQSQAVQADATIATRGGRAGPGPAQFVLYQDQRRRGRKRGQQNRAGR